ncbi:MAG: 4Fe-4S ferredoxin [Candidatus Dadabacteria bacterium]
MIKAGLDEIYKCIHCGICLPECPTYRVTKLETESPRGRIHLSRAVAEGRIEPNDRFEEHIYLCLGCRACESVCPSGVRFGKILESAREIIGPTGSPLGRFLTNTALKRLLPSPTRLRILARILRLYQKSPLRTPLHNLLPDSLIQAKSLLPDIPEKFFSPEEETLLPLGKKRFRVGFISGCVMSILFGNVNEATARVLRRNGCEVVIPKNQTCCGALNVHNGETRVAKEMAKRNIDAFLGRNLDAIIANSAGCGAMLKEYGEFLRDDPRYSEKAEIFSRKIKDISEFLCGIPLARDPIRLNLRVTYQDPCHLAHGQRIINQPRDLIRSIPGVELVEMESSNRCCGSAGIYNITHPEMSQVILDEKIEKIKKTGVDVVVAPNPGCMIQIKSGIKKHKLKMEVLHIVELIDWAYKNSEEKF